MKISRNQITGALLVVLGIVVIIMVSKFNIDMTAEYPGPKLFPLISAVGFIGLGIGIFFQKDDSKKIAISKQMVIRIAILFALTILYIMGLKFFGFLLTSPIYVFVTALLFTKASEVNKSKIWHLIIFAVVVTAVVYLVYTKAFSLRLPRGKLTKF